MLKKSYLKGNKTCRVTFKMPAEIGARKAALCGDFNEWNPKGTPMKKLKDGSFSVSVALAAGSAYRFRYLADGTLWLNDAEADGYTANPFGGEDCIVRV